MFRDRIQAFQAWSSRAWTTFSASSPTATTHVPLSSHANMLITSLKPCLWASAEAIFFASSFCSPPVSGEQKRKFLLFLRICSSFVSSEKPSLISSGRVSHSFLQTPIFPLPFLSYNIYITLWYNYFILWHFHFTESSLEVTDNCVHLCTLSG